MRQIKMPVLTRPWLNAAIVQMFSPISITFLMALMLRVYYERALIGQLLEEQNADEIKRIAPSGSISPLSCDHAIVEFADMVAYADQSRATFRKNVTMPFLRATIYELSLLALLAFFSFAPTWFVYALTTGQTTYLTAIGCAYFCYGLALPRALRLFTETTVKDDPRRKTK